MNSIPAGAVVSAAEPSPKTREEGATQRAGCERSSLTSMEIDEGLALVPMSKWPESAFPAPPTLKERMSEVETRAPDFRVVVWVIETL